MKHPISGPKHIFKKATQNPSRVVAQNNVLKPATRPVTILVSSRNALRRKMRTSRVSRVSLVRRRRDIVDIASDDWTVKLMIVSTTAMPTMTASKELQAQSSPRKWSLMPAQLMRKTISVQKNSVKPNSTQSHPDQYSSATSH